MDREIADLDTVTHGKFLVGKILADFARGKFLVSPGKYFVLVGKYPVVTGKFLDLDTIDFLVGKFPVGDDSRGWWRRVKAYRLV